MAAIKERVDKHDRDIVAIKKLIHAGMKMVVRAEERSKRAEERFEIETAAAREDMRQTRMVQRETDRLLKETIKETDRRQKKTDRQLRELRATVDRVVRSIQHGEGNGHSKKRIE